MLFEDLKEAREKNWKQTERKQRSWNNQGGAKQWILHGGCERVKWEWKSTRGVLTSSPAIVFISHGACRFALNSHRACGIPNKKKSTSYFRRQSNNGNILTHHTGCADPDNLFLAVFPNDLLQDFGGFFNLARILNDWKAIFIKDFFARTHLESSWKHFSFNCKLVNLVISISRLWIQALSISE